MNTIQAKKSILDTIIENRNGHYCHVVEVSDVYELENLCEVIHMDFEDTHTITEITNFLESIEVIAYDCEKELTVEDENEIYNFSFKTFMKENY